MQSKLSKQLGVDGDSRKFQWASWVPVILFVIVALWLLAIFNGDPTGQAFFSFLTN